MIMTHGSMGKSLAGILGPRIVTGELAQPTTTEDLAKQYAVSRTVVRDALAELRAKGLVAVRSGTGITPAPREEWVLSDPDVLRWVLPGDTRLNNEAQGLLIAINEYGGGPLSEALCQMLEQALA